MAEQGELIAAIVADPNADAAWRAYADHLGNDPRGAWIRASLASADERVATTPPIDDALLLSPRLERQWHLLDFAWWRGFIRGAGLMGAMDDPPTSETIDALFADPHAALLSRLSIMHPLAETVPIWQAVLAAPRPTITHFAATNLGDGGARLDALPNLETLDLVGLAERAFPASFPGRRCTAPVEQLTSGSLRELTTSPVSCPAATTGRFELPHLEALVLATDVFSRGQPSAPMFESADSLLNRAPPALRTLRCFWVVDASLAMLARTRVLGQLRRVEWFGANKLATTFADLIEHASAFRHLDELQLSVMDKHPAADVERWRNDLEQALPDTKLAVRWDDVVERPPSLPTVVDADSRDENGRVNAIARFTNYRRD